MVNGSISTGLETAGQQGSFDYYRDPGSAVRAWFSSFWRPRRPGWTGRLERRAPPGFGDSSGGYSRRAARPSGGRRLPADVAAPAALAAAAAVAATMGDAGAEAPIAARASATGAVEAAAACLWIRRKRATLGNSAVNARPVVPEWADAREAFHGEFPVWRASVGGALKIPHRRSKRQGVHVFELSRDSLNQSLRRLRYGADDARASRRFLAILREQCARQRIRSHHWRSIPR